MNTPHLYYVPELTKWANENQTKHPEAGWIPARPLGFQGFSLKRRLKLAWAVFTGKYDAVYWEPTMRDLWPRMDDSDLREALAHATQAAKGVNIFTANAVPATELALTTATPAMTFKEPPGEEQVADEAAIMAAVAAGTHMYNQ